MLAARSAAGSSSLPSRGAWIEINSIKTRVEPLAVAPLAGSVDRNSFRM